MTDSRFIQLIQDPANALKWWQLRDTEAHYDRALRASYGAFWEQAKHQPNFKLNPECAMWQRAFKQATLDWHLAAEASR